MVYLVPFAGGIAPERRARYEPRELETPHGGSAHRTGHAAEQAAHTAAEEDSERHLPSVSVVIGAYNASGTIERALKSVYAQTYRGPIEVIVVDDGSTDDTGEVVKSRFPQAEYVYQENAGVGLAKNTGVKVSTSELIAFLDADDEWLPQKLERQVSVLTRAPGAALVTCFPMVIYEKRRHRRCSAPSQHCSATQATFRDWLMRDPGIFNAVYPSGWLVRRKAFETVGPFLPTQSQDFEFLLRLTAQGYTTLVMREQLYNYYLHEGQVTARPERKTEGMRRVMEYIRECHPSEGAPWARGILSDAEYAGAFCRMVRRLLPIMCAYGCWDLAGELTTEALSLCRSWHAVMCWHTARAGLWLAKSALGNPMGRCATQWLLRIRSFLRRRLLFGA